MGKYYSKSSGEIAKALGLSRVRDFSLHFPFNGVATVKAEIVLTQEQVVAVQAAIEKDGVKAVEGRESIDSIRAELSKMDASLEERVLKIVSDERRRGGFGRFFR